MDKVDTFNWIVLPIVHAYWWIGETGMSGHWLQDPGMVSIYFTSIDKGNTRINIITNVVLPGGCGIDVCWTRSRSDAGEQKRKT